MSYNLTPHPIHRWSFMVSLFVPSCIFQSSFLLSREVPVVCVKSRSLPRAPNPPDPDERET